MLSYEWILLFFIIYYYNLYVLHSLVQDTTIHNISVG